MNRSGVCAQGYLMFLAAVVLLPVLAFAGEAKTTAELENFVIQDCGSCHGLTFNGGLGPPLRPADLELLPEVAISAIIREGVPGTAMPPWKALLTDREIAWISNQLKTGALLTNHTRSQ